MTFYIKGRSVKILLFLLVGFVLHPTLASSVRNPSDSSFSRFSPKRATFVFQAGGFSASQGSAQNIGIQGLIGDHFTVAHQQAQNLFFGLGYFVDGLNQDKFNVMYGLNAFYLAHTSVQGNVVQEQLFTNLSYHYSLTHYPIYVAAKALINTNSDKFTVTLDLGVGPNIINASHFREGSLDGGVTVPDTAFSGRIGVAFSATAGMGIRLNNVLGHVPLEIGYRFFYLGQTHLNKLNNQFTNTLSTGNNYANALVFSVSV